MEPKDKELEHTVSCGKCGKVIYVNEICSCQQQELPKWMSDIKSNTDTAIKKNRHVG